MLPALQFHAHSCHCQVLPRQGDAEQGNVATVSLPNDADGIIVYYVGGKIRDTRRPHDFDRRSTWPKPCPGTQT